MFNSSKVHSILLQELLVQHLKQKNSSARFRKHSYVAFSFIRFRSFQFLSTFSLNFLLTTNFTNEKYITLRFHWKKFPFFFTVQKYCIKSTLLRVNISIIMIIIIIIIIIININIIV